MNIDGLGFQGLHGNNGVDGKNNNKNKTDGNTGTEGNTPTSGVSAPPENNIDKVQEFYLKFKAGVLSFEELCSRLEGLGVELKYQKDSEDNNIVGVTFEAKDGPVYCSVDGKHSNVETSNKSQNTITTSEEDGLVVTTEKHPDGTSTITKKDQNGNPVAIEERDANDQIIKLTSFNKAGKIECVKEYEYNNDGSYIETVKNGNGRVVKKTAVSEDGKTKEDITPNYAKSILNGQLFSMEDIIEAGFNSIDIAKHFTLVKGNDENFYYEIKTDAGNAQSLEDFYVGIMQEKADQVIAKYESGTITFAEIMQELKAVGFTGISGKANADGSCMIEYQCGNNTYSIEDTSLRDLNQDWIKCITSGESVENFADNLENYKGVTDVEYSKTDYGSEKISFKFNNILHTLVSIPEKLEIPDEKDEEK